jgi:hypothetical protein
MDAFSTHVSREAGFARRAHPGVARVLPFGASNVPDVAVAGSSVRDARAGRDGGVHLELHRRSARVVTRPENEWPVGCSTSRKQVAACGQLTAFEQEHAGLLASNEDEGCKPTPGFWEQ